MATRTGIGSDSLEALASRLLALGVSEADLTERFVRSSGPGGQNVNKTSSAVHLVHAASGIEIKAQQSRSQAQNRYRARIRLAEKLEAARDGKLSREQAEREKVRRQKRRRSRRAKAKMLDDKSQAAAKKRSRQAPKPHDD